MNKTVLIADDDYDLVQVLRTRCESLGLRVCTAYDALEALNQIHATRPDLICLDVKMPCGTGLSVLDMLAADDDLRNTPAIILTGAAEAETIRRCHDRAAYYVEKCSDVWPRIEPILHDLFDDPLFTLLDEKQR